MKLGKLARGPLLWILLSLGLVLIATSVISSMNGPEEVDTGTIVKEIPRNFDRSRHEKVVALAEALVFSADGPERGTPC